MMLNSHHARLASAMSANRRCRWWRSWERDYRRNYDRDIDDIPAEDRGPDTRARSARGVPANLRSRPALPARRAVPVPQGSPQDPAQGPAALLAVAGLSGAGRGRHGRSVAHSVAGGPPRANAPPPGPLAAPPRAALVAGVAPPADGRQLLAVCIRPPAGTTTAFLTEAEASEWETTIR